MAGLFEAIGGAAGCRTLATKFYARVERDLLLRPLFPGTTFRCAIEEFSAFLVQFLGGPSEESQFRWWLSLRESHLRFKIGQKERDAWMKNMIQAFDDAELSGRVRGALLGFFERSSAYVANQGHVRGEGKLSPEVAPRWEVQLAIDQAVAAIRRGDTEAAIALAEGAPLRSFFRKDRALFAFLLSLMIQHGMVDYVSSQLHADPLLAQVRYNGRTLLHTAAASGAPGIVETLLNLGADPNALDGGRHAPLYSVANECQVPAGADITRILIRHGAEVNACDGAKRCTALHMAARRGSVEIAGALLDCGADIEARDSVGETPLRRAVNCNKVEAARLLLSRGADPRSKGSKNLTPATAARSEAMKRIFRKPG